MERIVKGIWIPLEIWEAEDLCWNEKVLLMEIDSYTSKGRDCYISNQYVMDLLGVAERTAKAYISHLLAAGYVRQTHFDGRKRYLESMVKNCPAGVQKSARQRCKSLHGRGAENCTHTYNNLPDNSSTDVERDDSLYKSARARFVPPTLEEVKAYIQERGSIVDPEAFHAFYTSNGWKVGKAQMKDWHAAVTTWERRRREEKSTPSPTPSPRGIRKGDYVLNNLRTLDALNGTHHVDDYMKRKNGKDYDEQ